MIWPYIQITRPVNLLMIILVQSVLKYGLIDPLTTTTLDHLDFILLVFATICIAAAGNVVNDIFDINVDSINKPDKMIVWRMIPERAAYNYYIVLNVLGVAAGFLLANRIGKPGLSAIFILISALLYIYATHVKALLIIGNMLVSAIVSTSLLVVVLFDIYPLLDGGLTAIQASISKTVLIYAGFAFYINLMREIVKDLQDIDGDKNGGRNSLPIAMGRQRSVYVVFGMGLMGLIAVLLFTYVQLYTVQSLTLYFIFLIAAPLLFFLIKAWNAENKKDYARLSLLLKLIMISGICSLLLYAKLLTS